jgi:hypothetical protein
MKVPRTARYAEAASAAPAKCWSLRARQSETADAAMTVTGSTGDNHLAVRMAAGIRWKLG